MFHHKPPLNGWAVLLSGGLDYHGRPLEPLEFHYHKLDYPSARAITAKAEFECHWFKRTEWRVRDRDGAERRGTVPQAEYYYADERAVRVPRPAELADLPGEWRL